MPLILIKAHLLLGCGLTKKIKFVHDAFCYRPRAKCETADTERRKRKLQWMNHPDFCCVFLGLEWDLKPDSVDNYLRRLAWTFSVKWINVDSACNQGRGLRESYVCICRGCVSSECVKSVSELVALTACVFHSWSRHVPLGFSRSHCRKTDFKGLSSSAGRVGRVKSVGLLLLQLKILTLTRLEDIYEMIRLSLDFLCSLPWLILHHCMLSEQDLNVQKCSCRTCLY